MEPRKRHCDWLMEATHHASITFIVRLRPGKRGDVSGIVERVRTGEKHRFHGAAAIGPLIAGMVRQDTQRFRTRPPAAGVKSLALRQTDGDHHDNSTAV